MLISGHTYLLFKYHTRTYFCEIYKNLWDLIGAKLTKFKVLKYQLDPTGGRPDQESVNQVVDRCARGRAQGPA